MTSRPITTEAVLAALEGLARGTDSDTCREVCNDAIAVIISLQARTQPIPELDEMRKLRMRITVAEGTLDTVAALIETARQ
jgi:hypothetical protein